jgi:FkbM family methyltransferase
MSVVSNYRPGDESRSPRPICKPLERDVSRWGEYTFLQEYLPRLKPGVHLTAVDVGAFGKKASNTWNLICEDGWGGLLVEPNPPYARRCQQEFRGNFRVVETAVADYVGRSTLHRYSISGWESLNPDRVTRLRQQSTKRAPRLRSSVTVPVTTLPKVLAAYHVPAHFGVLSVDTESLDSKVLAPLFASAWRPAFILVEEDCDFQMFRDADYLLLYAQTDEKIWLHRPSMK